MASLPVDYYDRLVHEAIASGTAETRHRSNVIRVGDVRVGDILSLLSQPDGHPISFIAAFLAVMDFNSRQSTFTSNLRQLTEKCDFYLTIRFRAPQYSPIQAGRYFQEEYLLGRNDRRVRGMAVLGPARSAEAEIIATMGGSMPDQETGEADEVPDSPSLASQDGIPNIAASATSAELEDRVQYPFFARTTPTDRVRAVALGWYLKSIGVRRLAVVHINDSYGRAYANVMREVAREHNIRLFVVSYHDGVAESIMGAVNRLKAADYTYHLLVAAGRAETMFTIMYDLLDASLIGVPDKTWILGEDLHTADGYYNPRISEAMNRTILLKVAQPKEQARTMDARVTSFVQDHNLLEYFLAKQVGGPFSKIHNATQYQSHSYRQRSTNPSTLMAYDAVMALGLAACQAPQEFFTGPELYESLKRVHFEGASGDVRFDNVTATRPFGNASVANVIMEQNGTKRSNIAESMIIDSGSGHIEILNPLIFADGSTIPPPSLNPVVENMNLLSKGEQVACWVMSGIVLLFAAGCVIWTVVNRQKPKVKLSQPAFLFALESGSFLLGSSIIPTIFQEPMSSTTLDVGCMLSVWLASMGFSTGFSCLLSRTWRINRVYNESRRGRRIQIQVKDVVIPVVVLLSTNILLLTTWTIVRPLKWSRIPMDTDSFGRTTSSIGTCIRPADPVQIAFASLIVCVNFLTLCLSNWMTYQARNLPRQFNDNPFVGIANIILLECVIIGLPILFVTSRDPASFAVVQSLLLAIVSVAILLPVVLPFALGARGRDNQRNRAPIGSLASTNFNPDKARCCIQHYPWAPVDTHVYGSSRIRVTGVSVPTGTSACNSVGQRCPELQTHSLQVSSARHLALEPPLQGNYTQSQNSERQSLSSFAEVHGERSEQGTARVATEATLNEQLHQRMSRVPVSRAVMLHEAFT